jgi:glycosyl transferase family 87
LSRSLLSRIALCLASLALASSMWFYVDAILVRYQIADSAAHNRPRGNLSDLYPRWLGARELLLHGRNPYGNDITIEIQKGYFGRKLDPSLLNDPKDQQAFAYPVYVVFLLGPTTKLPFEWVQAAFRWILVGVSIASVCLWLKVLRWNLSLVGVFICTILLLGSFPEVQGLKLQQLSLLVAALLAAAVACVASGYLTAGGAILALATIKPQLALPLVTALLLWTAGDWKARWRFAAGFGGTMGILLAASEFVLPGWIGMFWQATRDYRAYTNAQSILDQLVNWGLGPWGGSFLAAIAALASGVLLWRFPSAKRTSEDFGRAIALVMALTLLVIPMDSPYNQVLLLPSILMLAREFKRLTSSSTAVRTVYFGGVFALAWAWVASVTLTGVWCFSHTAAMAAWKLPLYATFALPVLVFMLTFLAVRQHAVLQARDAAR